MPVGVDKREQIIEQAEFLGVEVFLLDGHDQAILGLVEIPQSMFGTKNQYVVAYSTKLILLRLYQDGMTRHEAQEFFDFNIAGAYLGSATPVYVRDEWIGFSQV